MKKLSLILLLLSFHLPLVVLLQAHAENGIDKAKSIIITGNDLPTDFLGLADLRATVNSEITILENDISKLKAESEKRKSLTSQIPYYEDQIRKIQGKQIQTDNDRLQSDKLNIKVQSIKDELSSLQQDDTKLNEKISLLAEKKELSKKIQLSLVQMLNPEQKFKLTMSITFAILIGCVIIGFFIISWHDEKIRQAIFSGESGIQFLTLFSLVIAIILFGITQILEGKELAALLGGLSGYILGRVAPKESKKISEDK